MRGYTFRPIDGAFRVLSWGRGVPSTALAVLSALGHLEKLDAVIHADTGWEHQHTYEVGAMYSKFLSRRGLCCYEVSAGSILLDGARRHVHMPFWTETGAPIMRQCSSHFKIKPQKRLARVLAGFNETKPPHPPPGSIENWIGFTIEEVSRMRASRVGFIVNRFPLIELRMSRRDCMNILEEQGMPIPGASSCVGCPYKSNARWSATSASDLDSAIRFDDALRDTKIDGVHSAIFLHQSGRRLRDVDFKTTPTSGPDFMLQLFGCDEGVCGL